MDTYDKVFENVFAVNSHQVLNKLLNFFKTKFLHLGDKEFPYKIYVTIYSEH